MRLQRIKQGFTLIELLVVITIIGILATGATATYTSQIQKARDSTRISDMTAVRGALEQAYSDMTQYPNNEPVAGTSAVCNYNLTDFTDNSSLICIVNLGYLDKLPSDPKIGQNGSGTTLIYSYFGFDNDGVNLQAYEISTGVESTGMRSSKANGDGGNDPERVEFGMVGKGVYTDIPASTSVINCAEAGGVVNTITGGPTNEDQAIVFGGGAGDCSGS